MPPHSSSHNLYSLSRFFHVYRLAGPGLCRERKGEDDQDSAGGAISSSTGFGSFVSIASASSNIWRREKRDVLRGRVNTKMKSL